MTAVLPPLSYLILLVFSTATKILSATIALADFLVKKNVHIEHKKMNFLLIVGENDCCIVTGKSGFS